MNKISHTQVSKISSQVLKIYHDRGLQEFKKMFTNSLEYILDYCKNDMKEVDEKVSVIVMSLLGHIFVDDNKNVLKAYSEIIHPSLVFGDLKRKIQSVVNEVGTFLESLNENEISLSQKVKEYLKKRSEKELKMMTADYLMEQFGYSRSLFFKILKEQDGRTPAEMIMYEKLNRSFEMLKEGYFEDKICKLLGFGKPETFRNQFKKQFNFLPSDVSK